MQVGQDLPPVDPYVGVSGLCCQGEQAVIERYAAKYLPDTGHFLMLGVMASMNSQLSCLANPVLSAWYPVGRAIEQAAAPAREPAVQPFVHLDPRLIASPEPLMDRVGHFAQGVQLNGLPLVERSASFHVRRFHDRYSHLKIVLQAHRKTFMDYKPAEVAEKVSRLPVQYLLLDASQSRGQPFSINKFTMYIDAIYQRQLGVRVVVAGGLDGQSLLELFAPLHARYPGLSCDAAKQLHRGTPGFSRLNLKAVREYLEVWRQIVGNSPSPHISATVE